MSGKVSPEVRQIMEERFGCDTLISVATMWEGRPFVRGVNGFYEDGAFYVVTHAKSAKMKHIGKNPEVAVCAEWFSGHGIGENLGHVCREENRDIADKLRVVFQEWYDNGHVDEEDPDTCILKIRLTDGILFSHGTRYEIEF